MGPSKRCMSRPSKIYDKRTFMNFKIECEREIDGRWIAEVPQLPGVLAYGNSSDEAMAKTEVLALRVLADRLEQHETRAININISIIQTA